MTKKNSIDARNLGTRNIAFIGMVSFFTDVGTQMVYPIIPLYLVSTLGATPALVGVIEGIAESLASLLRVLSGYITDRFYKKKALAFLGYATGAIAKLPLLFATTWLGVLSSRVVDRTGKGIRTAPRDVLVSESADKKTQGRAFGLHKGLDMLGAALGIVIAYLILKNLGSDVEAYKRLIGYSMIPAVLALAMFLFIKQKPISTTRDTRNNAPSGTPHEKREPFWKNIKKIDNQLKLYLAVVFIFTLGNSSNQFMLLRAYAAGFNDVNVVLLYFVFNFVAGVLSLPLGRLSDKIGRKNLLVPGYLAFAACYLGFAFVNGAIGIIAVFVLYGTYTAMITGVERAFIAEISPKELKGTMLGLHSTVAGIALLPASAVAGLLWDAFDERAPFFFGASLATLAALILLVFMRGKRTV